MPIRHSIIHQIDKKPDGTPAVLHVSSTELAESQVTENLLHDLNVAYNAKTGKAWGLFHAQSGAFPLSGWLHAYVEGGDLIEFSRTAVEHLTKLMEESNLSVGGHVLFAHYQQGMTDYLVVALLQHSESVTVNADLGVTPSKHLDFGNINLAARINISEWRSNPKSRQYISYRKVRKAAKQMTTSATSSAARRVSTGRAKPARCSRRSATLLPLRICTKTASARKLKH